MYLYIQNRSPPTQKADNHPIFEMFPSRLALLSDGGSAEAAAAAKTKAADIWPEHGARHRSCAAQKCA